MVEILGWVATALVVISFLFKRILLIRIVNLIGCLTWFIYGYVISSYPVMVTNCIISIIQIYWLIKIKIENK